jgi:hypothetical protein
MISTTFKRGQVGRSQGHVHETVPGPAESSWRRREMLPFDGKMLGVFSFMKLECGSCVL